MTHLRRGGMLNDELVINLLSSLTVKEFWQELNSCWDGRPFGHNSHGSKSGGLLCLSTGGAGSPSNTMWPEPRPTSVPSGILIYPTVCRNTPTLQTDRTNRTTVPWHRANRYL